MGFANLFHKDKIPTPTYDEFPYAESLGLPPYMKTDEKIVSQISYERNHNGGNENYIACKKLVDYVCQRAKDLLEQYTFQDVDDLLGYINLSKQDKKTLSDAFQTIYRHDREDAYMNIHSTIRLLNNNINRLDLSDERSRDSIFFDGHNLQRQQEKFLTLRPGNIQDMIERQFIAHQLSKSLSYPGQVADYVRFHGTSISSTEAIINSGGITSGADRNDVGRQTSEDSSGYISVTTPSTVAVTLEAYSAMDGYSTPGGCVFVIGSDPSKEDIKYVGALPGHPEMKTSVFMPNFEFAGNEDKLYAIITTSENVNKVNEWCQQQGIKPCAVAGLNMGMEMQRQIYERYQNQSNDFALERN